MFSGTPGNQLEELCTRANQEVILVSPFIKYGVLARLLKKIPEGVEIHCVTRWLVDEIAAGVSDVDIWLLSNNGSLFTLWLRPDLHAKYYRADDTCMVGSANLTHSALGWSNRSNLELLVPLSKETTSLVQFEQNLFTNCVRVNHSVYDQIKKAVEAYKENHSVVPVETNFERNNADLSSVEISSFTTWIPSLRDPSLLYLAYIGASEKLTIASRESAYRDLAALSVIPGLSQRAFELSVRALLLQNPTIRAIDDFTIVPQRFGAVSAFLKSLPCAKVKNFDAKRAWQTIMRWLLYFFPERYSVLTPRHSEIFFRIDTRA